MSLAYSCSERIKYEENCSDQPKYLKAFDLPEGLKGYNSYELALACAQATKKPMAIYFAGKGCVNCEAFEKDFLYTKNKIEQLNQHFIFAYLSIDDNTPLPEEDRRFVQHKYSDQKRWVRTVGQLNSSLVHKYEHSSQPSLFIVSAEEEILGLIQYDPDSRNLKRQFEEIVKGISR